MSDDPKTLGEELPQEIARVRDLMGQYQQIGAHGLFAVTMMERALRRADKAMIEGDIVEMIRAYQDLKGFTE